MLTYASMFACLVMVAFAPDMVAFAPAIVAGALDIAPDGAVVDFI